MDLPSAMRPSTCRRDSTASVQPAVFAGGMTSQSIPSDVNRRVWNGLRLSNHKFWVWLSFRGSLVDGPGSRQTVRSSTPHPTRLLLMARYTSPVSSRGQAPEKPHVRARLPQTSHVVKVWLSC
jgi:hypothetical protein